MSGSSVVPSRRNPSLEMRRSRSSSSLSDAQSAASISRTVSPRKALSRLRIRRRNGKRLAVNPDLHVTTTALYFLLEIGAVSMDPNVQNILLGAAANALTSILERGVRATRHLLRARDQTPESIAGLLSQATAETSDTFTWKGKAPIEEVCLFLSSAEVNAIVRQVFAAQLLNNEGRYHIAEIEREFVLSLKVSVGEPEADGTAALLFAELLRACEVMLNRAVERGLLAAHEAKSMLRHKLLVEELGAIKQNLAFLTSAKPPNLKTIVEFDAKYRRQVAQRHGDIIPPNFDSARRIAIDRLY